MATATAAVNLSPQALTCERKPSARVHVPLHVHPHSHPGQIAGSIYPALRDLLMLILARCIKTGAERLICGGRGGRDGCGGHGDAMDVADAGT